MSSEDKFWAIFWIYPTILFVVVTLALTYYNVRLLELGYPISAGQTPVVVKPVK